MRKSIFKRVAAAVCATVLTVAMTTSCFAADKWGSYFGCNMGWNEAAIGELTAQSEDGWTAKMDLIGWGGVWGAQVKDENINLKAGVEYELKFTMQSSDIDKWIFVKVTNAENDLLYGDWVQIKKGKKTSYDKTFTLEADATAIFFGIGGEFGDRTDEEEMYKLTSTLPDDVDSAFATTITCSGYSLAEVAKEAAPKEDSPKKDDDPAEDTTTSAPTTTSTTTTSTVVKTGDFTPIACAGVAVIAAAAIVVFTRKREEA